MRRAATPKPCEGDIRIRREFALIPIKVCGYWVWLGRYWSKYHFVEAETYMDSDGWVEVRRAFTRAELSD